MPDKYWDSQKNGYAILSPNSASATLVEAHGDTLYPYLQRITLSVFDPAQGGDGILQFMSSDGGPVFWTMNVDAVKDVPFNFGGKGLRLERGDGVYVLVSGAAVQASLSVAVSVIFDND